MYNIREYKDRTDFPAESYLQVNTCGRRRIAGQDFTILRSKGRGDYHVIYIQQGWIAVEIEGRMQRLEAGECIIYPPGTRQLFSFAAQGKPVAYYIHFAGIAADEAMALLEPNSTMVYTIADRTVFEGLFHQLVYIYNTYRVYGEPKRPVSAPVVNGILLQLIDILVKSSTTRPDRAQSDILMASAYIQEHFNEPINLEKCAGNMHLSLSRFAHLFTEKMGISPHKFILQLRIDTAKELLTYSLMSVGEIAESIGFSDPAYFSRLFRKSTGVSPMTYRSKN